MQHTKCLFGVLVCALVASVARCENDKEARLLDGDALQTALELALKPKQAASLAPAKERVVEIKPRYGGYAHKEKVTVQGERQTHFPADYSIFPLAKRTGNTQETTVDIKPLYMSYAAKPQSAAIAPTLPFYALGAFGAASWPGYPAPYPYAQRGLSPYSFGTAPQSFVIINPTNYPTYHYYSPSNQSRSRAAFSVNDAASDEVMENDVEDQLSNGKSLEAAGESVLPVEMNPNFVTMSEAVGDERSLVESILEQAHAANDKDHPLVELLLQQEHRPDQLQLRKRVQERVAAVYFRNYNANRK